MIAFYRYDVRQGAIDGRMRYSLELRSVKPHVWNAFPDPAVIDPATLCVIRTALMGQKLRQDRVGYGLVVLLCVCVLRLWVMPLGSSFWVDEMATAFVVEHGEADPSLRVAPQVPASVYYALPRASVRVLGFSEAAYRLPSLLAMLMALWLIARIAARLIHPDAAWFAVFACLSLRGFNYQADDARPYGLGTLALCAGVWFLIRWLDSNRWPDAAAFEICAALLCRVHLVFWPFYALFALYAAARLRRGETGVTGWRAAAVFALVGLSLIPVAAQAVAINRAAGQHVVSALPGTAAFTDSLKLGLLVVSAAAAATVARLRREHGEPMPKGTAIALIATWWVCAPIGLFLFSWVTGNATFVQRYLYAGLPGTALAATLAAAVFVPPSHWRGLSLAFGTGVLLMMGNWTALWPAHQHSDWRGAARAINALGLGADTPILCPSPFIEARPPVWRPDYPLNSFLYSELLVYKMVGREYPFPFDNSPEAQENARALAEGALRAARLFAIYGSEGSVEKWRDWFAARPEFAQWRHRELGNFGDVKAVLFSAD